MVEKQSLIYPKSNLKEKSNAPGGMTPEEAIRKGEHTVKQMKFEYERWLHDDLKIMDNLLAELNTKPENKIEIYKNIKEKIHDIRGQGSTFGYALVSSVSHSLCRLIVETKPGNIPPYELMFLHVNSLHLVVDKNIEGLDSDGAKTLLKSLDAMVNKYLQNPDSLKL